MPRLTRACEVDARAAESYLSRLAVADAPVSPFSFFSSFCFCLASTFSSLRWLTYFCICIFNLNNRKTHHLIKCSFIKFRPRNNSVKIYIQFKSNTQEKMIKKISKNFFFFVLRLYSLAWRQRNSRPLSWRALQPPRRAWSARPAAWSD